MAYPGPCNDGVLDTVGRLVFQGCNCGAFNSYDTATGKPLWSGSILLCALGGAITYASAASSMWPWRSALAGRCTLTAAC